MGIFSRIGEIVNANITSMLDKAEDPEKMVRLMIHEMEDTLTEVKSSAAEVIADRIRIERKARRLRESEQAWEERAGLAISKKRDDLAREAIERKLLTGSQAAEAEAKLEEAEELVRHYQKDIARLEGQLKNAHKRQREIAVNMKRVQQRRKVEDRLSQINNSGAFARFEAYNNRLDRMEADLEVNTSANEPGLEQKFKELEQSGEIEAELQKLKKNQGKKTK